MTWNRKLSTACFALFVAVAAVLATLDSRAAPAKEPSASGELWMARAAQFLASDELEGRGLKTQGIHRAAKFIHDEFRRAGLDLSIGGKDGFQRFPVAVSSRLGEGNAMELLSPKSNPSRQHLSELVLGRDYTPLAISGSGKVDLPLVFVGYGISDAELNYDDYAGVDVTGKAVLVLRHEPQQANPHSSFNGTENSPHAPLLAKVSNAYQHGAAAVLFCTDQFEVNRRIADAQKRLRAAIEQRDEFRPKTHSSSANDSDKPSPQNKDEASRLEKQVARWKEKAHSENDDLMAFDAVDDVSAAREMPVLHCRRRVIDALLRAAAKPDLAALETAIDKGPQPQSFELEGCRIRGRVAIQRDMVDLDNILGAIAGQGPHAQQTIVVGAHYDHLGRGEAGSADPGNHEIHNGADDNASGTVVLIDVARRLVERNQPLDRQVLFVAFSGEERGLLGSAYFVRNPPVPLKSIVAMVNFDMVGRLRDNKLIVNGFDTAAQFDGWLDEVNEKYGFELVKHSGGFGPSDQATFYAKQIPVLHFFTGAHSDYHRPTDDFQLLNIQGMSRVSQLAADLIVKLANSERPIKYQRVAQPQQEAARRDPRPYFGSIPDFGQTGAGYAISGVSPGSPADDAGLRGGDRIVQLGPHRIGNLEDFDSALRKFEAGDRVPVVFMRGEQRIESQVILDPPR